MRKYILIGVLAFLGFAVVLMPASVARLAVNRVDGLAMRAVGGTLWNGQANLAYRGEGIGTLEWTSVPLGVLHGEVRVRWRLSDADLDLSGVAAQGLSHALLNASGHVGAAAVNRVLGRYDIAIEGDFEATDVALISDGSVRAAGAIAWSGGRTFYRLSGQNYDTAMPAMVAEIRTVDGEHTLDAKLADDSAAPLILARLKSTGWIEIGLTRRFTTLAGKALADPRGRRRRGAYGRRATLPLNAAVHRKPLGGLVKSPAPRAVQEQAPLGRHPQTPFIEQAPKEAWRPAALV